MKTSKEGVDLIKRFEGFRAKPYYCSAGTLTIGYGHTKTVRKDMFVTEAQAEALLKDDLSDAERAVNNMVNVKINQHQFDALVSFVFNLGAGNFGRSTLLKKLNKGDFTGAANEFPKWCRAGGVVLTGLKKRRIAEKQLFEKE